VRPECRAGGTAGGEGGSAAPGEPAADPGSLATAGTPVPPGVVAIAQPGQPISNKAVELRVTGHRTAPGIGGQSAGDGREFLIVDSA